MSGVLAFTERAVREVMTPRTDIVALPEGASLEEVGQLFTDSGYSRLPVYRDSLDNIIGMVYAFDLLKVTPGSELPLRPVVPTPGSNECAALLLELQRQGRQMAVVLDEYGGTAGIATVEDLLEELVGEIFDDDDLPEVSDAGPDLMEISGSTPAQDVATRFAIDLPNGIETIGGFIARETGRIPQPGERLVFNGLEFDVLEGSSTRIERIVVRRGPVRPITIDHLHRTP
jgi:CBS domain containing-hemolysin-like protein